MEDEINQTPEEYPRRTLFFPPVILKIIALLVILAILVSNYLIWVQPLLSEWIFDAGEEDREKPEDEIEPPDNYNVQQLNAARASPDRPNHQHTLEQSLSHPGVYSKQIQVKNN